ncbi:MAG TPA: ACT domain-containing protein, partial [Thauera aminoaromatica]|nr:ACT domain-containing protein [Thauera aminoaromatica]
IADADIDVDMIIQNAPRDGSTDLSFTVARADLARAVKVLEGVQAHVGARSIESDDTMCKVSVVGVGMRSHPGVAAKMFRTLAEEGINIQMITSSEIRISVAIEEKHLERAVRALHKAYGLDVAAE